MFSALGDFSEVRAASTDGQRAGDLSLPFDLRGIEAKTVPPAFRGVGYGAPPGDLHLTLWDDFSACDLLSEEEAMVPASSGGQALTAFADGGALLVAGLEPPAGRIQDAAFALAWDTQTGERLAPLARGMGIYRRAFASATPFGRGALVAGGMDPKFLPERPVAEALVFLDGTFQGPIQLDEPRARHGAVVLANGETLLVGGEGISGEVLSSLVVVAPQEGGALGEAGDPGAR